MRRYRLAWFISALACGTGASTADVSMIGGDPRLDRASAVRGEVFTDRLLVRFRSAETLKAVRCGALQNEAGEFKALLEAWRVQDVGLVFDPLPADAALASRLGMDRWAVLRVPEGTDVEQMARAFAAFDVIVDGVDIDRNAQAHTPRVTDPLFPGQWHLQNTGQLVNGVQATPGADIRVVGAWEAAPPLSQVLVAVLDTGVSLSHPDLNAVLVPGRNFASTDPAAYDDNTNISHGTYCAGVAGAGWNNQLGGTGLGPNVRILPVRVLQNISLGSQSTCASGLTWAADNGARVISMSLGWASSSQTGVLYTAVQYAAARNIVICASVGNTPGAPVAFPAKWPEVIAVGGTDLADGAWVGATTGLELDIVAPADSILTTSDDASGLNAYSMQSGTSMSCPMVAGAAALVLGANPTLLPADVRNILLTTARDLGTPGFDSQFGFGRLNVEGAVVAARQTLPCQANFNRVDGVTIEDVFDFLNAWFTGTMSADVDRNGLLAPSDVFAFLDIWMAGCP